MKPKLNTLIVFVATVVMLVSCNDRLLEIIEKTEEKSSAIRLARTNPNMSAELEKAKALYNRYEKAQEWLQPRGGGVKRTLINDAYMPHFQGDPSWKYYTVTGNDSLVVVDVDMTDCVMQDFVPEENARRYLATGDERYRRSYTRYVYIRNLYNGGEESYYMTIVPSLKYAERYNSRMRRNLYLSRDKNLDGIVLFHTLTGMFVNGWQYKDGKIVGKILPHGILPAEKSKGKLKLKRAKAKYKVSMKVSFRRATSNDNEEDGIKGPTLPELEVIGEKGKDDGDDCDDFEGWGENPDYGEDPDLYGPNGESSGGGGGGTGCAGLSGSDASASLARLKTELKAELNIEIKGDVDYRDLRQLLETVAKMKNTEIGRKLCEYVCQSKNITLKISDEGNNQFDSKSMILTFEKYKCMDIKVVCEELAHIAAYFRFGEGVSGNMANFEFEAKVVADLIYSQQSEYMAYIVTMNCDDGMPEKYDDFIRGNVFDESEYRQIQQWWYERQVELGTWYGKLPYDRHADYLLFKELTEGK
ncbi:MAG: hypothetical protein ACI30L_07680 [Muribaculaceae bacterium]